MAVTPLYGRGEVGRGWEEMGLEGNNSAENDRVCQSYSDVKHTLVIIFSRHSVCGKFSGIFARMHLP